MHPQINAFWQGVCLCLLATSLFMIVAIANGYPLFFNDTRSYVRQPALIIKALTKHDLVSAWPGSQDNTEAVNSVKEQDISNTVKNNGITSNRSIYYGFLALLGYVVGNFWATALIQSALTAVSAYILIAHATSRVATVYLSTVLLTSICSCVGFYTGYIMPDIFAPIMIISACSLLFFYRQLSAGEITFVLLAIAYSVLAHPSHQVILIAMTLCFSLWVWLAHVEDIAFGKPVVAILACILFGILGQFAFNKGLALYTGQKPLLLPHIEAHLIDMGPGTDYAKFSCDPNRFVVCRYKDRFPMYWETFIGDPDPDKGVFAPADLETKRRLSDEQIPFALAVLKYDPIGLMTGLVRDAVTQLFRFSLKDFIVDKAARDNYEGRFPPDIAMHIKNSTVSESAELIRRISAFYTLIVGVSVLCIVYFSAMFRKLDRTDRGGVNVLRVSGFLVLGVVLNGLICGLLASPYDRFQARVVWLIVFVAALMGTQLLTLKAGRAHLKLKRNH